MMLAAFMVAHLLSSATAFSYSTRSSGRKALVSRRRQPTRTGTSWLESKKDNDEEEKYLKRINESKQNSKKSKTLASIFQQQAEIKGDDVDTTEKALMAEAERKRKQNVFAFLEDVLGSVVNGPAVAGAVESAVQQSERANPSYDGDPSATQTSVTRSSVSSPPKKEAKGKSKLAQQFESVKTAIVGLFAGGIAVTPITALHDILFPGETITNGLAQWEFDTDTGSISAALFAIVYRYCVREGEEKDTMLPMGVIGAFVIVRTVSRVRVSYYCDAVPLDCGDPFGYFDWSMLQQLMFSGLESVVLFGATAAAMDYCYEKGYISRIE
jgi:hypothetical protein